MACPGETKVNQKGEVECGPKKTEQEIQDEFEKQQKAKKLQNAVEDKGFFQNLFK